eukprot:TRINITY_DN26788_c0_g1_i1.p1 TRINITY_DN26788_c0_g1~~TRINITY_DN26788_c0_g1_i1.p1  ORF type:complete len:546 (-),score=57.10 TRINITY_DN26788_c0_g1_i1:37-1470(-)
MVVDGRPGVDDAPDQEHAAPPMEQEIPNPSPETSSASTDADAIADVRSEIKDERVQVADDDVAVRSTEQDVPDVTTEANLQDSYFDTAGAFDDEILPAHELGQEHATGSLDQDYLSLDAENAVAFTDLGVVEILVEKRPELTAEHDQEDIQTLVLNELNGMRNGIVPEKRGQISFEDILDDDGHIARGGIVAVVRCLSSAPLGNCAMNFYRSKPFRKWVTNKPLNMLTNRLFPKENDVWVVRLMDAESSRETMPNLNSWSVTGPGGSPSPDLQADILTNTSLLTALSVPAPGASELSPSFVPSDGEQFTFRLTRSRSDSPTLAGWEWYLHFIRRGQSVSILGNDPDDWLFMKAQESPQLNDALMVKDSNDRELFEVRGEGSNKYTIFPPNSDVVLFTLEHNQSVLSEMYNMSIWKGDYELQLYAGKGRIGHGFDYYHALDGPHAGKAFTTSSEEPLFTAYAHADTALLLVSATTLRW